MKYYVRHRPTKENPLRPSGRLCTIIMQGRLYRIITQGQLPLLSDKKKKSKKKNNNTTASYCLLSFVFTTLCLKFPTSLLLIWTTFPIWCERRDLNRMFFLLNCSQPPYFLFNFKPTAFAQHFGPNQPLDQGRISSAIANIVSNLGSSAIKWSSITAKKTTEVSNSGLDGQVSVLSSLRNPTLCHKSLAGNPGAPAPTISWVLLLLID